MSVKSKTKTIRILTCVLTLCIIFAASIIGVYPATAADSVSEKTLPKVVQTDTRNPDLTIHINDAPVLIENKETEKISASYNSRYYDVSIEQSLEGEWHVDISVLNSNTNKSVILYIPDVVYNSVQIEIDNGMYSGEVFNAKSITANVDNGGLDFSLSNEFDGSVKIDAYNSTFHLVSLGNYENFNVEMLSDNKSLGSAPSYFDCVNGKYTYVNGTGINLMNISLRGGSVGSLE